MIWLALAAAAAPPLPPPCGTMDLLPFAPPRARVAAFAPGPVGARDFYGVPNERRSEHFVLRWGDDGGPIDETLLDNVLESLELGWQVQVDEYGHPAPPSTSAFLFNAYIGDSGDGAPSALGNAGYYWVDPQGFPYLVIARQFVVEDGGAYAHNTAIHEWYHALQDATQRYSYDGISAWYWEATAEWSTYETDPFDPYNGTFGWAFLMQPQYAQQFFDYPDTGAITEYRQYGAYLLPRYVTQRYGFEAVRDTWLDPSPENDPLEVMRSVLASGGVDLDEVWLDHLASNATFDFTDGETQRFYVDFYETYYESFRVTREAEGAGKAGSVRGDSAPFRYGAASIHLANPIAGTLRAEVLGDALGTEGHEAEWGARVAIVHGNGEIETLPVPFDGATGALEVPGIGPRDDVWLVVGAWSEDDSAWLLERFGFDWSLTVEPSAPPAETADTGTEPEEGGGCGCAAGSAGGGWALIGLTAWARRRRTA